MLDCSGEDLPCLIQVAAGVQYPINLGPIFGPLLDLVEIAVIRNERIVGLFGGLAHCG